MLEFFMDKNVKRNILVNLYGLMSIITLGYILWNNTLSDVIDNYFIYQLMIVKDYGNFIGCCFIIISCVNGIQKMVKTDKWLIYNALFGRYETAR